MDKTSAILPGALEQYRINEGGAKTKKGELGQQAFFDLMVTQLQNQDPMNPMESGDFLGQIAQFSTVNGISALQESFATLSSALQSNQALQASTMVGRDVVVPGAEVALKAGGTVALSTTLPAAAANVRITIADAVGQVVRHVSLGAQNPGKLNYDWDGLNDSGAPSRAGTYKISIDAGINGLTQSLDAAVRARVDSVSLGRNGLPPTLNVDGYGPVDMSDVLEIL